MLLASLTACGRSGGLGTQEEQASGLALEAGAPSHMPAREPQRMTGQLGHSRAVPPARFLAAS